MFKSAFDWFVLSYQYVEKFSAIKVKHKAILWRYLSVDKTIRFKIKKKKRKITYGHVHKLFANTIAWEIIFGLVVWNAKEWRIGKLRELILLCGLLWDVTPYLVTNCFSPESSVFILSWIKHFEQWFVIFTLRHNRKSGKRIFFSD